MANIAQRLQELESYVHSMGGKIDKIVTSDFIKNWRVAYTNESLGGVYLALCVNTKDPLKRNRVQFYTDVLNDSSTDIKDLPWANPISTLGGFDDSGVTWIPPAGSTIVVMFAGGNRNTAFYLGTIHPVSRGTAPYQWGYEIQEYYDIWNGHRDGYLVGPDDGSQLLPPWTSENYNAIDSAQFATFDDDPQAFNKVTFPNIYGIKSPDKHGIKMVGGDHRCNDRWKRFEIFSARGNIILMKDDHLNPGGQWANPICTAQGQDLSVCTDDAGNPLQGTSCGSTTAPNANGLNVGSNPYYKRKEECRLYAGAPTPQNNACALPQSGLQLQSISGHQLVMDDSVEEPSGVPRWDLDFDFGCTDKFTGKFGLKSATGHSITLNDKESNTNVRDDGNGITLKTASGITVELNDHTVGASAGGCPPNQAGTNRRFKVQTTSNHVLEMNDSGNTQCSPARKEGGEPAAKASGAFCLLRTGYGLQIRLSDDNSQEKTQKQSIEMVCPDKDNPDNFHMFRMQVSNDTNKPGYIFMRCGGVMEVVTKSHSIEVVGGQADDDPPASKIIDTNDQFIVQSKNTFIAADEDVFLFAKQRAFILAGEDCPSTNDPTTLEPCILPIIVFDGGVLKISDRVFASTSKDAPQVQLQMVLGAIEQQNAQQDA